MKRLLQAASWALLGLAGALPAPAQDAPFRGDADIALGDVVHAAFPSLAPGARAQPHTYAVFATEGTVLTASVRPDAGASLRPSLRLTHPGGERVELGASRRAGDLRIGRFRVRFAGVYVLEVTARSGDGGYTLTTGGRIGRGFTGLYPDAPVGEAEFGFEAPQGVRLTARVTPRGRGPRIEITSLVTPPGEPLPVLSIQRGAGAEIRRVPLAEDGRWRLVWSNRGTPGGLRIAFTFRRGAGSRPVRELGVSDGLAASVIERGDPALPARAGYAGSAACGRCHDAIVRTWSRTAHNTGVRAWDRAGLSGLTMTNDADGNGADDFRDGLDLATTPAFAAFGAAAPKLSHVPGEALPYRVRIGAATYAVERTMGGNGLWTQRWLTRIGGEFHVLPFEFDETGRAYAAVDVADWYDAERAPRGAPPHERSFEAQCSGCHNTGETFAGDAAGGFSTGYVELNVGCEQCHGPGAEHARTGDVRRIANPRGLLDGTAAGVALANAVCARCHTKGASVGALPGTAARTQFGFLRGPPHAVARFGDAPELFLTPTSDPADTWGFAATRTDRPHAGDIAAGPHGPLTPDAATCFECHDPHERRNPHQVATSVDRGVRVQTRTEDNTLCLACHAGQEPLAGTTPADAAAIRGGPAPASVARAVLNHMKDIGMPLRDGLYDPQGTGVGRCTTCHMPQTPTQGPPGTDRAGFAAGTLHSHRFRIVWPNASERHGVTNSCNACHPTDALDIVGPILTQWAAPGASTSYHGAVPPASLDGNALDGAMNPQRDGGVRCVACHTSEGFVRVQVRSETLGQAQATAIAQDAVSLERGVTCDACHGRRADGRFDGSERNPLRLPKTDLCTTCHNAATIVLQDFRDHGAVVRHPQREMLAGTAGDAPPGAPAVATTAHSNFTDGCVTCHYDADHALGTHDFQPALATCTQCHTGLATFDRTAGGDYDGDGQVRGIQTEVTGLLDRLKAALLADPRMRFADGRFDFAGAADHALAGAAGAQSRAVFNWYSVDDDGSRGVHNAARAVGLLQRSYRELTGSDIPGAALR